MTPAEGSHPGPGLGDASHPDAPDAPGDPARRQELSRGLDHARERIARASAEAGRTEVPTLIVVTKFFPRTDLDRLIDLGVRDVGENKEQEAAAKVGERDGLPDDLRVHFVGQLQSKKSASVARWADVVHSVDRLKLVGTLSRAVQNQGRPLTALVQVDLDPDSASDRGGVQPEDVGALADAIADSALTLGGVMAVAPIDADPDRAFERLAEVAAAVRRDHPGATWISAGMSGDLEAAIRHGATHLRVGSAILGSRQSHR